MIVLECCLDRGDGLLLLSGRRDCEGGEGRGEIGKGIVLVMGVDAYLGPSWLVI